MTEPRKFLFSSEQVSAGHPDKLCDFISDSILDAALTISKDSRVAIETAAKMNSVMVFGEITCPGELNFEKIVRNAAKEVGYDDIAKGFDYKNCMVIVNVDKQSQEIQDAVGKLEEEDIGAGDQGIMFGYATDEDPSFMPVSYVYANNLLKKLKECMENGTLPWLRPDAKSQVTVEYEETDKGMKPLRVHTILISTQHDPHLDNQTIGSAIKEHVIQKVIPADMLTEDTRYCLNPSGSFVVGGPTSDAGLTGRKIIADTYGGWGSHGGGCFSGKDPSKVDRSGAYMGRWIAKSLVASGLCHRCLVQLSYGIGVPEPLSIMVNSYGTAADCGFTDLELDQIVAKNFDCRAGKLVSGLDLKRPIFKNTTLYGHFLKSGEDCSWENPKDLSHEKKTN